MFSYTELKFTLLSTLIAICIYGYYQELCIQSVSTEHCKLISFSEGHQLGGLDLELLSLLNRHLLNFGSVSLCVVET